MRPVQQPRPNTKPTKPALKALTQAHKHNSYLDVHAEKSGENLGFGHSTARVCRWISEVSGAEPAIFCGGETLSDSTHQLKCDTIYTAHVAVSALSPSLAPPLRAVGVICVRRALVAALALIGFHAVAWAGD